MTLPSPPQDRLPDGFAVVLDPRTTRRDGGATLLGVNQRDLVTFEVDHARAERMASAIPAGIVKVAESGVRDVRLLKALVEHRPVNAAREPMFGVYADCVQPGVVEPPGADDVRGQRRLGGAHRPDVKVVNLGDLGQVVEKRPHRQWVDVRRDRVEGEIDRLARRGVVVAPAERGDQVPHRL